MSSDSWMNGNNGAARLSDGPRYLTKKDAATYLGVCERTIDNWRGRGLRARKKGAIVRFAIADLDEFMEREGG